jgi:hypothetical protein
LTTDELRQDIFSRYYVGQVVNMRKRDPNTDKIVKRFKITILGFYPHFVLTEKNGAKECFTYADYKYLTRLEKG